MTAPALDLREIYALKSLKGQLDAGRPAEIALLGRPLERGLNLDEIGTGAVPMELLNVAGRVLRTETVEVSDTADLSPAQRAVLAQAYGLQAKTGETGNELAGKAIVQYFQASDGSLREIAASIDGARRYEASAWFERDRKHLHLADRLTDRSVVNLWDQAVDEEIEAGFLTAPRLPRPRDADWLHPLLTYAREQGLTEELATMPARKTAVVKP